MERLFKGHLCQGIHTQSGYYAGFVIWPISPAICGEIKEFWLFTPEGKQICYFDPSDYKHFFKESYDFDSVIGAHIKVNWETENKLIIEVKGENNDEIELILDIPEWQIGPFPIFKGLTGKNKNFSLESEKIGIPKLIDLIFNKKNLGSLIKPTKVVTAGAAIMPESPRILKCKMIMD